MPTQKLTLLLVEDDVAVRQSLSAILAGSGYTIRSAEDGFAALAEIRNEVPDIILSDLNMPGMSGFELLSVVRRRFPLIRVIAMSGAYSGSDVPAGVIADAFYEKGTGLRSLLQIVEATAPSRKRRPAPQRPATPAPIWIPKNGHDPSGEEYVTIPCPECLRTFPQVLGQSARLVETAVCVFCRCSMDYAIVPPTDMPPQAARRAPSPGMRVS